MYQSLPSQIATGMLLVIAALAFWRGRTEQRLAAAVITVTWLFSGLVQDRGNLFGLQIGLFAVDVVVVIGLTWIAVRWPQLWAQACAAFSWLQLMTHAAMAIDDRVHWRAYLTALALWSVSQLVALAWGVWVADRSRRAVRRESRPEPSP